VLSQLPELARRLRASGDAEAADLLDASWVSSDAEFAVEQIPPAIGRTLDGIARVAAIVRAMKAFSHPGSETRAPSDLNEALATTLAVCRNEYKYVADVETDLGEIPLVTCQLGELNQVFLNLLVNAAHAIAENVAGTRARGVIKVATRREGAAVLVSISDSGAGIPAAVRDRIFDPFFTTKAVGKGTGQGLTLARTIVVKHGGTLTFASEPQRGTTFEIRLPVADARADGGPS
ncbi:MAG TPA: ATP-binding protein, partial [Labilithrix sp.]|nr:ATP-binding protein [Labilithrix sp.]